MTYNDFKPSFRCLHLLFTRSSRTYVPMLLKVSFFLGQENINFLSERYGMQQQGFLREVLIYTSLQCHVR